MRDKRPVDELSIAELERILAIRKREARQAQFGRDQRRSIDERRIVTPHVQPLEPAETSVETAVGTADAEPIEAPQFEDELQATASPPPEPVVEEIEPRFEEDFAPRKKKRVPPNPARAKLWNRTLLGVEIAAVLGLVLLFVALFASLQNLTRASNEIQVQAQQTLLAMQVVPTATPAINVSKIVLPGGHTYADGEAKLNLEEVPVQYRDAYQQLASLAPAAPPTASPQGPLAVRIPAIGVDKPVVTGDGWEELKRGVGHHVGSANPAERGNMVLTAHNDVFGEIFRDLEKLKPGDKIYVRTQSREVVYVVRFSEIVLPSEVRVLDNTQRNISQITLITCYPYRVDNHRYIVYGELESS
jgi:sortase A